MPLRRFLTPVLAVLLLTGTGHPASLKHVMQELGEQMGHLNDALWREDYATVANAATAIAGHAHVDHGEMHRVMGKLGPEMDRFEQYDEQVHSAAAALATAAKQRDSAGVMRQLQTVQQGCVGCHQTFRGRLRQAP